MKKLTFLIILISCSLPSQSLAPAQYIFMQGNNINSVFGTNGIYNYDTTYSMGFLWPAISNQRLTAIFASGFFIGAKVGPQHDLRLAASIYNSHYTSGNIPVIGQVPPASVCSDPSWRGYYVQLTDPTLFNGGTRIKTAGGRQYTFNYDSWAAWPVQKGAPYVEVNGIPGYQPAWNGDKPGIGNGMTARPEELLFMVYMDYTNCTNNLHDSIINAGNTLPLGVEIHQLVFNFNCTPLRDMYFTKYFIINKSLLQWDSTYFAVVSDEEIGNAGDDATGCDTTRNLGFMYNADNDDPDYGINPPSVGVRLLQGPLRYTGNPLDTAYLPYDTIAGYISVGMTTHNSYKNTGCFSDPRNAVQGYNYLMGFDKCGNQMINWVTGQSTKFRYSGDACNRSGWFDSTRADKKNFIGSGPLIMNSLDTQIIVASYMITRDGGNNFQNVCALQSLSDSALKYYYNDFKTCIPIGIEPISNEIPKKFELFQNYPNPFNPSTKIKFSIPVRNGHDRSLLKIYDAIGREVAILVNEELKSGTYEIEWNAENLPSGVFFYSLITNDFTQTRKMVVLK